MRMTARSPPMMTNPFTFPEFDSSSFFQASFASPPPAPASGPSLLDDQESSAFADFLDKVGTGNDAAFIFDPKMSLFDPKLPDPMMWGWHQDTTTEYPFQPSTTAPAALTATNVVATPLSSERSTYVLKREDHDDDDDDHSGSDHIGGNTGMPTGTSSALSIQPTDINLDVDPFAVLHRAATAAAIKSVSAAVAEHRPHIQAPGLQWGSDPNFKFGGFSGSTTELAKKEDILIERTMAMLAKGGDSLGTTAANTAANSPAERLAYPGVHEAKRDEPLVSPSKRRKSFHRKMSEEEEYYGSSSCSPQPRSSSRPMPKDDLTSPASGAAKQKKKKKSKGPKRENLSEAQKRENHIQSEQKRRNLIREGFEDLCNMVPELRGGGYSKSAILMHTANFLEQLEEGNQVLQMQVKRLGGSR
ncbi:hypothetical protein DRE_03207 [Drechslerella stenobrocha 248]|uniref:BHLH domain-containing protein n=1 Tax=Drechslerella stenobrocha 248 TaxID=1043628 RepID=W7I580_9PEZI|nr:hypothetical protein DRE_03207 [Drechslerella stenobrocha 248]